MFSKKLLLSLILVFGLVGFVYADSVTTPFGWQQVIVPPVTSWDIFVADSATGPWTVLKNVPYYVLSGGATEYTASAAVTVPANAVTVKYFQARANGANGLVSDPSNTISKSYDRRVTPPAPTGFRSLD